ncbi:MAG: hypothetical protein QGI49_00255 [SAR202 cluster bacterium]|jgi:hypothetical protein|nr:hypothetical protein [SAR202 cluster bacterium]
MIKYWVFVFLSVAAIVLFFVGLLGNLVPLLLAGAVLLFVLFLTRLVFMPIPEPD